MGQKEGSQVRLGITDQTVHSSSQTRPDWDKIPRRWLGDGGEISLVTWEKLALNTGQNRGQLVMLGEVPRASDQLGVGWSPVRQQGSLRLQVSL